MSMDCALYSSVSGYMPMAGAMPGWLKESYDDMDLLLLGSGGSVVESGRLERFAFTDYAIAERAFRLTRASTRNAEMLRRLWTVDATATRGCAPGALLGALRS